MTVYEDMVPDKITHPRQHVISLNIGASVFHQIENHRKLLNSIYHIGAAYLIQNFKYGPH